MCFRIVWKTCLVSRKQLVAVEGHATNIDLIKILIDSIK